MMLAQAALDVVQFGQKGLAALKVRHAFGSECQGAGGTLHQSHPEAFLDA